MPLKEFTVRIPDEEGIVVAAKIPTPAADSVGWNTLMRIDGSVDAFMTVNGTYLPLQNGRTVQDCYTAYVGKPSFRDKHGKCEFSVFAYRHLIDGCAVGTKMQFKDIDSGEYKTLRTFWNYSVAVLDPSFVKNEIALAPDGVITVDTMSKMMRERCNLHLILEGVLSEILEKSPFSEMRKRSSEISQKIIAEFINSGAVNHTGFQLKAMTLGNIELVEG